MTRSSKLGHVGEAKHHAAAQSAAGDPHVTGIRPLTSFEVKAFNVTGGGEAVEAPDDKDVVFNNFDTEVTAGVQHGGHSVPGVSAWVIGFSSVQTTGPIESTNLEEKRVMVIIIIILTSFLHGYHQGTLLATNSILHLSFFTAFTSSSLLFHCFYFFLCSS